MANDIIDFQSGNALIILLL